MSIEKIRLAASKRILYLPHAVAQMSRIDRMISTDDIERVIFYGEIIEDYPEDKRSPSCLLLGKDLTDNPVHVVCSAQNEFLAIITAYRPSLTEWDGKFRERKTK